MADGFVHSTGGSALVNVQTIVGMGNAMGSLVAAYKGRQYPLIVTAGQQTREMVLCEPYLVNRDETWPLPWVTWATSNIIAPP
jgi:benzoylformate decarboxylase